MTTEEFWNRLIADRNNPNHVVVNGSHYQIQTEKPATPRRRRGFGGDRYNIRFHDGRTVTSTNLWCQGCIPLRFREQLPDNAVFVKETRA